MTEEKKNEIVTSVKMADLINKSRQKITPDSALFFATWWAFYFWFFVFKASQMFSLPDTKTLSTPELASSYQGLQATATTTAIVLALLPFAGYAICWASLTSGARDNFMRKIINTFADVFLASLLEAALLLVIYAVAGGILVFFMLAHAPEQLKNFFWIGAMFLVGGFMMVAAIVMLLAIVSLLYLYFSNLVRKLSISAP